MKPKSYIRDLFFAIRFYIIWGILVLIFIGSFFITGLSIVAWAYFILILFVSLLDYIILFFTKNTVLAVRKNEMRFSNGDENLVKIIIESDFKIHLRAEIIDELPEQFQQRDFLINKNIKPKEVFIVDYKLSPNERGEYNFGDIHVYVQTKLGLVQRRFTTHQSETIKVYPSFLQMKKHAIKSLPNVNGQTGGRDKTNRGSSSEFDHIKEYNRGDDVRTINWKASARRNSLMVNSYMDEKSKQVYCIIDKGRLMKMPFENLTLLDYSINATLMFTYTALQKDDKVGVVTFAEKVTDYLQASKSRKQFNAINETLYKQETQFLESDFASLYSVMNKKAGQRSLLMLFTNFETYTGFERQLTYLQMLNRKHLLCVIIFENTELNQIHQTRGDSLEDIYIKTIADKFTFEKKRIVKEMQKNGILVVYTKPQELTIQIINKYLEIKARQLI